jgi:NAD(P)H-dependent FMN reductase
MKLEVIIASTRPGRIGDQIGKWIAEYAAANSEFDVGIADLLEFNLPIFDEPNHPITGIYTKDQTKAWAKRIAAADAFIVVTPEYNFTMPPSLLNAIDYLHTEWRRKPVAFVGYGVVGASRAIQSGRTLFSSLNAMPIGPAMTLIGVHAMAVKTFEPNMERGKQPADAMLSELVVWANALKPTRARK